MEVMEGDWTETQARREADALRQSDQYDSVSEWVIGSERNGSSQTNIIRDDCHIGQIQFPSIGRDPAQSGQ